MHAIRYFSTAAILFAVLSVCSSCTSEPSSTEPVESSDSDARLESVRSRLQRAIDTTDELRARAREAREEEIGRWRYYVLKSYLSKHGLPTDETELHPTFDDLHRYARRRPWTIVYGSIWNQGATVSKSYENAFCPDDAPALRELLTDADPAIRCMAIEALATLHRPEDIPRIARMLDDESPGPPIIGWNYAGGTCSAPPPFYFVQFQPPPEDLHFCRSWHDLRVKDYARLALLLVTGEDFTSAEDSPESFAPWWERNQNSTHHLWYWQNRLRNEICEARAVHFPNARLNPRLYEVQFCFEVEPSERMKLIMTRIDAVRRKTVDELLLLPPEVEAKVRLLVGNQAIYTCDFFYPRLTKWSKIGRLRLSADRLLDLLERKGLWKDVEWNSPDSYGPYNRMLQRLMLASSDIFGPEHRDRLWAIHEREKETLSREGRAAMLIAISRLSPPATSEELDDPATRDGALRAVVREYPRAVAEMVRVALPQNWSFLKEHFLTQSDGSFNCLIEALGEPSAIDAHRIALLDLLSDERFKPLFLRPSTHHLTTFRAVKNLTGEEIIEEPLQTRLDDEALAELLEKSIATLSQSEIVQPTLE